MANLNFYAKAYYNHRGERLLSNPGQVLQYRSIRSPDFATGQ